MLRVGHRERSENLGDATLSMEEWRALRGRAGVGCGTATFLVVVQSMQTRLLHPSKTCWKHERGFVRGIPTPAKTTRPPEVDLSSFFDVRPFVICGGGGEEGIGVVV